MRLPDLVARPLGAQAISDLIDRKPHLLRPLAARYMPPPLAAGEPAERLGLDLGSLRTIGDLGQAMWTVLEGIAQGEITSAAGLRIARRADALVRARRHLGREASGGCDPPRRRRNRRRGSLVLHPSADLL